MRAVGRLEHVVTSFVSRRRRLHRLHRLHHLHCHCHHRHGLQIAGHKVLRPTFEADSDPSVNVDRASVGSPLLFFPNHLVDTVIEFNNRGKRFSTI